jgi:hypothetical protein
MPIAGCDLNHIRDVQHRLGRVAIVGGAITQAAKATAAAGQYGAIWCEQEELTVASTHCLKLAHHILPDRRCSGLPRHHVC